MKKTGDTFVSLILLSSWIGGVVLADGWETLLAIFFPFYAWYLIVEKLMQTWGMV